MSSPVKVGRVRGGIDTMTVTHSGTGVAEEHRAKGDLPAIAAIAADATHTLPLRSLLMFLDGTAVLTCWLFELQARHRAARRRREAAVMATVATVIAVGTATAQGLYRTRVCAVRTVEVALVARAAAASGVAVVGVGAVIDVNLPTTAAIEGAAIAFIILVVVRGLFSSWLRVCRSAGRYLRDV